MVDLQTTKEYYSLKQPQKLYYDISSAVFSSFNTFNAIIKYHIRNIEVFKFLLPW